MSNGPTHELGPILAEIDTQTRAISDDVTDIYNHVRDLFGMITEKGNTVGSPPTPAMPRLREHFAALTRIHEDVQLIRRTLATHMDGTEGAKTLR